MSTRSAIIMKTDDGYAGIYCHFDGYPSGVGQTLLDNYQDLEKVNDLIRLGDISQLGARVVPIGEHSYGQPETNTTVAYMRDRGESGCYFSAGATVAEVAATIGHNGYVYVFENSAWTCNDIPACPGDKGGGLRCWIDLDREYDATGISLPSGDGGLERRLSPPLMLTGFELVAHVATFRKGIAEREKAIATIDTLITTGGKTMQDGLIHCSDLDALFLCPGKFAAERAARERNIDHRQSDDATGATEGRNKHAEVAALLKRSQVNSHDIRPYGHFDVGVLRCQHRASVGRTEHDLSDRSPDGSRNIVGDS